MRKGIAVGIFLGILMTLAGGAICLFVHDKIRPQVSQVQVFTWNNFIMLAARKDDVEFIYLYGGNGSSQLKQNWNIVSAVDLNTLGNKEGLQETMQVGSDSSAQNKNEMLNEFQFMKNGNP
jgi:hypothetical protein